MKKSKNILTDKEMELVSLLMKDCQSTGDIQSKLKRLFVGTIEQMLEAGMDEHLGYEKHSVEGNNRGNSRNGYNHKTIISDYGGSEIAIPRATEMVNLNQESLESGFKLASGNRPNPPNSGSPGLHRPSGGWRP